MKNILCFGDSNTHGTNPSGGPRFDHETRWPGVLRRELGAGWWIVEEGCGGRTTVWEDPIEGHKSGSAYLPACLHSHQPLDLVIILLGTNDLKLRFGLGAQDIARGCGTLVDLCQRSAAGVGGRPPRVLLLSPPRLAPLAGTGFAQMFAGAEDKSFRLGPEYREVARLKNCEFLDLAEIVASSPLDGIHWGAGEHAKLGRAVAAKLRSLF